RLPKRRLVMVSQSVLFAQALLLAGLVQFGRVQYWHVAVLALLYGVANTVDMPTRQAFIVETVGRDDLMNAIALNSAMFNAARIVGPALAGFAIAHWGVPIAFFVNALSFVPVMIVLASIRTVGAPRAPTGRTMGEEIREGVRYAVRTPRVALTMAMILAVSGFLFNYTVLVPLFARDLLGQGARGFGRLQLDRAAHGARRAARPRDEPAHARLRRQHAVRRLPHRLRGRGGGRDDGPARGRGRRAGVGAGAAPVVERSRSWAVAGGPAP